MEKTEAADGQSYELLPNGATSVLINDPVQEEEFSAFLQSYKHYETFLDTKVKKVNEDLTELDFSFLLQPSTRQHQVDDSLEDINDELIFKEDTVNLKAIDDLKSWHGPWNHPILSTYIYLKTIKYKGIYAWNLWSFVLIFIMPFIALFVVRHNFVPNHTKNASLELAYNSTRCLCLFSVLYLALVEVARFTLSYRSLLLYLREVRNLLEVSLTIVAGFTLFSFCFMNTETYFLSISILGTLSALSLLCKIYWTSYSPFSMLLKRIAISFFCYFFLCVAFIVLVKFLFRKAIFSNLFSIGNDNSTIDVVIVNNTSPSSVDDDAFDDDDESSGSNKDYKTLDESGESVLGSIKEEADLVFEMTCYFVIAFMAVCKDIYTFVDPEKRTTVTRVNACNYLEMSRTFTNSYEKHGLGGKRIEDLSIFKRWVMRFSRWLINRQHQQHLHKIEKVCVNWKTGEVSVRFDGDQKVIATISKQRSLDDFRRFSESTSTSSAE